MQGIVLLGAPGAGKGTAAGYIADRSNYLQLSTGDMLRNEIQLGTKIGKEAQALMEAGLLVSDEIILRLVEKKLQEGKSGQQYMFDGFPRTVQQAVMLDEVMAASHAELIGVFYLEVDENIVVARLGGRRICKNCRAVYHTENNPPNVVGVCDRCGGELYQREDDNVETVMQRLHVYHEQTAELVNYYSDKGILVRVDASGSSEGPGRAILNKLNQIDE